MKNTHRISTYLLSVMLLLGIVYAGTERAMPEAGLWKVITLQLKTAVGGSSQATLTPADLGR